MTAAERKRKSRMKKVAGMTDEERKEYKKKENERLKNLTIFH